MLIEGKVAKIIDKYSIAANIGREDGVREGMEFEVYEEGPEIHDPETDEFLGQPEIVKATLEVTNVDDEYSVMETKERTRKLGGLAGILHSTVQEKLKTDEDITIKKDRKAVKRGDKIRQANEDQSLPS